MKKTNYLKWLWISFLVIILDQLTKHLAIKHLSSLYPMHLSPFFNLTLTFNNGAAFSFLNSPGNWQHWFFGIISIVICTVIIFWLQKLPSQKKLMAIGLTFILGGALSNLIDRITLGYVIDFLDLYIKNWHWPVFNLADAAISTGVLLVVISMMNAKKL